MKFSIKNCISKCDQIQEIIKTISPNAPFSTPWKHQKTFSGGGKRVRWENGLMENFIFVQCQDPKTDSPATYTFLLKLLF